MTTADARPHLAGTIGSLRHRVWPGIVAFILLAAVVLGATAQISARSAYGDAQARARSTLDLQTSHLLGLLDKYRVLGPVLARRADVASLFAPGGTGAKDASAIATMTAAMTGAAEIIFVRTDGTVLGSSGITVPNVFQYAPGLAADLVADALQGRLGRLLVSAEGTDAWGHYFAAPVREDGAVTGIVVVRTNLEQVEQGWALSRDPIFATDARGRIILANAAARRVLGGSVWPPADAQRHPVPGGPVNGEGLVRFRHEARSAASDFLIVSHRMPLEAWTVTVLSDTGLPRAQVRKSVGLVGLALLIVAMALAFLILRIVIEHRAAVELERRVADRTRDLQAANARLEQEILDRLAVEQELHDAQEGLVHAAKLAALGQMSAAISHEFNQPLAAILSYASNGRELIVRGRTDEAAENMERISALVERMAELGRHLKTFARRPGSGMGEISLGRVIAETMLLVMPRARKARVAVTAEETPEEIVVLGGHTRLTQVFVNLLMNAIDAVEGRALGGVRLSVEVGPESVDIVVTDTGPGIAAETLEKIFEPFFTTKPAGAGTGLGLAIADKIVRDFGGRLAAANRPEGGAVFTVTLRRGGPVAHIPAQLAPAHARSDA